MLCSPWRNDLLLCKMRSFVILFTSLVFTIFSFVLLLHFGPSWASDLSLCHLSSCLLVHLSFNFFPLVPPLTIGVLLLLPPFVLSFFIDVVLKFYIRTVPVCIEISVHILHNPNTTTKQSLMTQRSAVTPEAGWWKSRREKPFSSRSVLFFSCYLFILSTRSSRISLVSLFVFFSSPSLYFFFSFLFNVSSPHFPTVYIQHASWGDIIFQYFPSAQHSFLLCWSFTLPKTWKGTLIRGSNGRRRESPRSLPITHKERNMAP